MGRACTVWQKVWRWGSARLKNSKEEEADKEWWRNAFKVILFRMGGMELRGKLPPHKWVCPCHIAYPYKSKADICASADRRYSQWLTCGRKDWLPMPAFVPSARQPTQPCCLMQTQTWYMYTQNIASSVSDVMEVAIHPIQPVAESWVYHYVYLCACHFIT